MTRASREPLPGGAVVLAVSGRPGPPPLRFETAQGGRLLLRQGPRPLLLGRKGGAIACCPDLAMHRLDGYRSPLPPLRSPGTRTPPDWPHRYARWLEEVEPDTVGGPLCDGRWKLAQRTAFAPGGWTEDFVREWPGGSLELYCGGGWHGVLPLRRLSPPDSPRVKAYRRRVREGTLAPVLLWWVSFLDGWLILDGHDRAVAALLEGAEPVCVVLERVEGEGVWRRIVEEVTEAHEERMRTLMSRPAHPGLARQRAALERGYAEAVSSLPYEGRHTSTWPIPGGAPAWDDLAARAMFECPRD
ncbi:hypothetical protein J7F01_20650 [Streptomyces sp. ISL-22]|nr:hypothetical protein [Streptomyces sp. ISL-24]MBT2434540.1 hypothetical protein [Streptomyces sp. ISL-22]